MKKVFLLLISVFVILSCKKTQYAPEGPTDVRIRNLSDLKFTEVTIKTSENEDDVVSLGDLDAGKESGYARVQKSYISIEVSAEINYNGTVATFTTGAVDFTYLQYIGQERITYEVYISNPGTKKLEITNRIYDEPLALK